MFGLEGSGFIISLGVTLLLCGVIAYYVKTQFALLDHKVSSMFQLVSALTGEVNKHESWWVQANNEILADQRVKQEEAQHAGNVDNRVQVSDSEISDSETEISDTESEDNLDIDNNGEEVTLSGVQHLTMGSELVSNNADDEVKIVELQMNNLEEFNLDDNVVENVNNEDEDEDNHDTEDESEIISDTEDESESMVTEADNVAAEEIQNVDVVKVENETKVVTQAEAQVDYKKLQVKALRQLVKERGLSENPSKINKKDLVKLLQA